MHIRVKTSEKSFRINSYWLVTILLIILKLSLHFFTNTRYELLRDEMLFFNMGEHLSAGQVTVPPITGFLAFLMNKIFGFSVFGIRFFPAIRGAISIYLISGIVRALGGGIPAQVIAVSSYLFAPGFLLMGTLFTPNSFEELIWLLSTWSIFMMVKTGNRKLWLLIGVCIGIGFLNKYSILFFVVGFFIALLFSKNKSLMTSKYFWLSVILGLIIIAPNIVWQYEHGWPVKIHMRELKSSQLDPMGYAGFPASLYTFSQGSAIIWVTGLIALLFFKEEKEYRYLGVATMAILLFFLILKGKGYYALVVLPLMFAFGGYVLEKYLTGSLLWVRYALFSVSLMVSLAALPSGLPVLSYDNYGTYVQKTHHFILHPLLKWENGTQHDFSQAYADMTGWKELTGFVSKAYTMLTEEDKKSCTIFGERDNGYAGAVYFYGRYFNLPEAITFHESYVFWAPDSIPEGALIYIYRNINNMDELFSDIIKIGSVDDKYFREKGLKVFLCKSPKEDITLIYKTLSLQEKIRYRRNKIIP